MNSNPNPPLVSIVLATYNGERFLEQQLDSLLKQTHPHLEIIAIDDGSSDDTVNILNRYAGQHPQLAVHVNEHNLGHVKTFEKGFKLAKGDFIAPCDQDDVWLPTKIEVLLKHIGNHAIAYCDSAFIDGQGRLLGQMMGDTKNMVDFDNPLSYVEVGISALGHAMLIAKPVALAAMPFPYRFSHDNWLGFVASFNGGVKFVDAVLVQYRRHDANQTNALNKKDRIKLAKKRKTRQQRIEYAQLRLMAMCEKCPDSLPEKAILYQLHKSQSSFSLTNNWLRMRLYFRHRQAILRHKKYHNPDLKQRLHCLRAFYKMI
ncbi:glycosyltransferase family 2 protein [Methylosoma difficile]